MVCGEGGLGGGWRLGDNINNSIINSGDDNVNDDDDDDDDYTAY